MPGDLPDWTAAVSNLRYLGKVHTVTGGGSLDLQLTALDRSVLVVMATSSLTTQRYQVTLTSQVLGITVFDQAVAGGTIQAIPVNVAADTFWTLSITDFSGATADAAFVFSDQAPVMIDIAARGRQNAGHSIPVVIASDQPSSWLGARKPYDSVLNSAPAAATVAQVVFPATAGFRWVLDYADFTIESAAGAASRVAPRVLDGGTALWTSVMTIPATAGAYLFMPLGPNLAMASSVGASLTVQFTAAPPANASERLNAAAYLV